MDDPRNAVERKVRLVWVITPWRRLLGETHGMSDARADTLAKRVLGSAVRLGWHHILLGHDVPPLQDRVSTFFRSAGLRHW